MVSFPRRVLQRVVLRFVPALTAFLPCLDAQIHIETFQGATAFSAYTKVQSGCKGCNLCPVMNGLYPSAPQDISNATTNNLNLSSPSSFANDLIDDPSSNAGRWHDSTDIQSMEEPKPTPRRRRPAGNEHVKHRRTRNGCYTCRSRRVKVRCSTRTS